MAQISQFVMHELELLKQRIDQIEKAKAKVQDFFPMLVQLTILQESLNQKIDAVFSQLPPEEQKQHKRDHNNKPQQINTQPSIQQFLEENKIFNENLFDAMSQMVKAREDEQKIWEQKLQFLQRFLGLIDNNGQEFGFQNLQEFVQQLVHQQVRNIYEQLKTKLVSNFEQQNNQQQKQISGQDEQIQQLHHLIDQISKQLQNQNQQSFQIVIDKQQKALASLQVSQTQNDDKQYKLQEEFNQLVKMNEQINKKFSEQEKQNELLKQELENLKQQNSSIKNEQQQINNSLNEQIQKHQIEIKLIQQQKIIEPSPIQPLANPQNNIPSQDLNADKQKQQSTIQKKEIQANQNFQANNQNSQFNQAQNQCQVQNTNPSFTLQPSINFQNQRQQNQSFPAFNQNFQNNVNNPPQSGNRNLISKTIIPQQIIQANQQSQQQQAQGQQSFGNNKIQVGNIGQQQGIVQPNQQSEALKQNQFLNEHQIQNIGQQQNFGQFNQQAQGQQSNNNFQGGNISQQQGIVQPNQQSEALKQNQFPNEYQGQNIGQQQNFGQFNQHSQGEQPIPNKSFPVRNFWQQQDKVQQANSIQPFFKNNFSPQNIQQQQDNSELNQQSCLQNLEQQQGPIQINEQPQGQQSIHNNFQLQQEFPKKISPNQQQQSLMKFNQQVEENIDIVILNVERQKKVKEFINQIYEATSRKRTAQGEQQAFVKQIQDFNDLCQYYNIHGVQTKRNLRQHCNSFRQARGDGNCFYTSFGFQFFQMLLIKFDDQLFQSSFQQLKQSLDKIDFEINYDGINVKDQILGQNIYNELLDRIQQLRIIIPNLQEREKRFCQYFAQHQQDEQNNFNLKQ